MLGRGGDGWPLNANGILYTGGLQGERCALYRAAR